MALADQLRNKATETAQKKPASVSIRVSKKAAVQNKRKEFIQKRSLGIQNGSAVLEFYEWLKERLNEQASGKGSPFYSTTNYDVEFTYMPKDFFKKRDDLFEKQNNDEEFWNDTVARLRAWDDITIPYQAFDDEECCLIKEQLSKLLKADGFRFSFSMREQESRWYRGTERLEKQSEKYHSCGYTIDINVNWHPWDTSREISERGISAVAERCADFLQDVKDSISFGPPHKRQKLMANLDMPSREVFVCCDNGIFKSGKNGFVISRQGFFHIHNCFATHISFQTFADEALWPSLGDYKSALINRKAAIISGLEFGCYGGETELEKFLKLVSDLQTIIRKDLT